MDIHLSPTAGLGDTWKSGRSTITPRNVWGLRKKQSRRPTKISVELDSTRSRGRACDSIIVAIASDLQV